MKKVYLLAGFLSASLVFAQKGKVGINTNMPSATLDVNGTLKVRTIAENADATQVLVKDNTGLVGYKSTASLAGTQLAGSTSIAVGGGQIQRKALTGDVTAPENDNNTKVVKIQGQAVVATPPQEGQILTYKGNQWTPTTPATGAQNSLMDLRIQKDNIETIVTHDATVKDTTYLAIVNGGDRVAAVRLPEMEEDKNIGKIVYIVKLDQNALTVNDSKGKPSSDSTSFVKGTTNVLPFKGKAFMWSGKFWYPITF